MPPFASFTLDHFRGLTGLALAGLGRINILVGANNSGKSSVLEAIELACDPLEMWNWIGVADQRDSRSNTVDRIDNILWLFPRGMETAHGHHALRLAFAGSMPLLELRAEVSLKIATSDELDESLSQRELFGDGRNKTRRVLDVDIWARRTEHSTRVHSFMLIEGARLVGEKSTNPELRTPCASIAPLSHRTRSIHAERLSSAKESGLVGETVALLQQFDPEIQDLDILARQGTFADLRIRHKTLGLAPLNAFGDGMRRALLYALTVPQVRGGVLLIDEIESAIHVKALGGVFAWLTRACTQFDVQLFASTHSLEALESLLGDDPEATAQVVGYHLPNRSGETTVTRYEGELLARLVRDRGLDVR